MKKSPLNIGNSQNQKIVTKMLKIGQNVFIYNESIIPLNNISRISVEGAPKEPYHLLQFGMILVGALCLFSGMALPTTIGLVLIGLGAWSIYKTYENNLERGEYLVLSLNSGEKIYLFSRDHDFTIEVMDVIVNCINSNGEYKVNMENCNIETCHFNENNIMSGGN